MILGTEIVWLASFPRSGNTLLRHCIEALTGISTFTYYPGEHYVQCGLKNSDNCQLTLDHVLCRGGPLFVKTHEAYHADTPTKAIYVVRDGPDAIASFAHFLNNLVLQTPGDIQRMMAALTERTDYGTWTTHIERWTGRHAPTSIVHYLDLCRQPHATLTRAFSEIGLESIRIDPELNPATFESLQKINPKFFRRGGSGYHKEEMSQETLKRFDELHIKTRAIVDSFCRTCQSQVSSSQTTSGPTS